MSTDTLSQKLINYVQKNGMIRSRELNGLGIPRVYLSRLVREGRLEGLTADFTNWLAAALLRISPWFRPPKGSRMVSLACYQP